MKNADFPTYAKEFWQTIKAALADDSYQPQPARRVSILRPDGGERLLGIPTVIDRIIQQAIAQVLILRIGAHTAVKAVQRDLKCGYKSAVNIDLSKFFDTVNHDILIHEVKGHLRDKRLLRLIGKYLRAGVLLGGEVLASGQGGNLSTPLANILLDRF